MTFALKFLLCIMINACLYAKAFNLIILLSSFIQIKRLIFRLYYAQWWEPGICQSITPIHTNIVIDSIRYLIFQKAYPYPLLDTYIYIFWNDCLQTAAGILHPTKLQTQPIPTLILHISRGNNHHCKKILVQ